MPTEKLIPQYFHRHQKLYDIVLKIKSIVCDYRSLGLLFLTATQNLDNFLISTLVHTIYYNFDILKKV